jgi:hypothetical protein
MAIELANAGIDEESIMKAVHSAYEKARGGKE